MKIAFIQNKGGNYGGVWQVNKMVGEGLINKGYDVSIISIRDDHLNIELEHDERLNVVTINKKDLWHTYYGKDFKKSLKKFKLFTLTKQLFCRLKNNYQLRKDKKNLTKYLDNYHPDYLIVSQYQVLNLIDEKYLNIVYCEQHTSFQDTKKNKANIKIFNAYKNKIKGFIWLTKKTMEEAIDYGFTNSVYIYNPVRFSTSEIADVVNNKKLVSISRIDRQKRIDIMIDIVSEIFKDKKYKDWTLEIYGIGVEFDSIKASIKTNQIKMMGTISNSKDALLTSSINLNTSDYEGFPMTILEGYECGVPTVSFIFGESVSESIDDTKTGYICKNKSEYIKKLKKLMDDKDLLLKLSKNCKIYNRKFDIKNIVPEWEKLFK